MDLHCGGLHGNDDRSDDDARRNGHPAHEQELRTGPDRGRESLLRSRGYVKANRRDAGPGAKGGITRNESNNGGADASVVCWPWESDERAARKCLYAAVGSYRHESAKAEGDPFG